MIAIVALCRVEMDTRHVHCEGVVKMDTHHVHCEGVVKMDTRHVHCVGVVKKDDTEGLDQYAKYHNDEKRNKIRMRH